MAGLWQTGGEQTGVAEAEHLRALAKAAAINMKPVDQELNDNRNDEIQVQSGENDPLLE